MTEHTATYNRIEAARAAAAGGIAGTAAAVHQLADGLPGGDGVKHAAHSTAEKLESTGSYLRRHDGNAMLADVSNLAGRNPGPSLLIAASLGFLIGWAFRKA